MVATIKNLLYATPSYVSPGCEVFKVIKRMKSAKTTVGNFIPCSAQKENGYYLKEWVSILRTSHLQMVFLLTKLKKKFTSSANLENHLLLQT